MRISAVVLKLILLVSLLAGASVTAMAAGKLYFRYKNDEGVTVIRDRVPPALVHRGYTVLDAQGRVIHVVPRELTEEERRNLSDSEAQARLNEEQKEIQRQIDKALLERYSTVADIEALAGRRINEVKVRINILKGNISGMRAQLEKNQAEAAELERQDMEVPTAILDNMSALREEIAETERMIGVRRVEMEALEARFNHDIDRFKYLLELRQQ